MKSSLLRVCGAGVILIYGSLIGTGQDIQARPSTRFRVAHDALIIVSLSANGQGPFDFVLDSGTDMTVVDAPLASQLALVPLGQMDQTSLAGRQTLVRSEIQALVFADQTVKGNRVLVEDLSGMQKIDSRIRGIIGQEFLSHFNYLLDYRRCSIQIEHGSSITDAMDGLEVPFALRHNKMVIEAESRSAHGAKLMLALDSGATSVILMKGAVERLRLPILENRWELTLDGNVSVHAGIVPRLYVGSETFSQVRAVFSTASNEEFADGLIPTTLFQTLYVNNQEGFVIFNPRVRKGFGR